MVPLAPRYDAKIAALVRKLDDRGEPIAETCRRVGSGATQLGLFRPSYSHLRRLILVEREYQDAIREVVDDVLESALFGLRLHPYELSGRVREARRLR
jgi:hypothetical protein